MAEFLGGGGLNRNPTPGVGRHVLNSSTTAACRICGPFWAFQNHRSLRYRTQGVIMLSRARYSWPGSNYPVMLDDCSAGPPPSAASAAEASLPALRSTRASFLSGVRPLPGSRPARLSMFAASDMGPFSGAYAADFVSLAEKSSLVKNLDSFCCHKNTSFCMTCWSACLRSPGLKRKHRFGTRATTRGRCSSRDPSATASSVTMTHAGTPRRRSCKAHPTRPLCIA